MANQSVPSQLSHSLTFPPAVKLSTKFANDLNEAEQASPPKDVLRIETTDINRPLTDTRILSDASSTNSNGTTLVYGEDEQEKPSSTQSQALNNDDVRLRFTHIVLRLRFFFRQQIARIGFCKSSPLDENLTAKGDDVFVTENCDAYPMGWPRLAAIQNRSDSCAVYRRFGLLFCRVLLQLQAEITALEKQLFRLDTEDEANKDRHYRLRSIDDHKKWDPAQRKILKQIREKLITYADLLNGDARLRELGPAPEGYHRNVYNWVCNHRPLEKGEDDFILHKEDFITPVKRSGKANGMNNFIEAYLSRRPQCPIKALLGYKNRKDQDEDGTYLFPTHRITLAANIIVVCIAISVLLIPVFVLYMANITRLQSSAIVLIFTVLFATIISLLADARVDTVFMSTCAYCAVLVVFLSNVQQNMVTAPSQ